MQPDGEGDWAVDEPVKSVSAGRRVVAPIGKHVVIAIGMRRRPGPRLGEYIDGLRERRDAEARGGGSHGRGVAEGHAQPRAAPRSGAPQALPQSDVMDPVAREERLAEEIEAVT